MNAEVEIPATTLKATIAEVPGLNELKGQNELLQTRQTNLEEKFNNLPKLKSSWLEPDDESDVTALLQKAVDNAKHTRLPVQVVSGHYNLTDTITIPPSISGRFCGVSNGRPNAFTSRHTGAQTVFRWRGGDKPAFRYQGIDWTLGLFSIVGAKIGIDVDKGAGVGTGKITALPISYIDCDDAIYVASTPSEEEKDDPDTTNREGRTEQNCDESLWVHQEFHDCVRCFVSSGDQAVGHHFLKPRATGGKTQFLYWFRAGGDLRVDNQYIGAGSGERREPLIVLYIADGQGGIGGNSGMYRVNGVNVDRDTGDATLLKSERSRDISVCFRDVDIGDGLRMSRGMIDVEGGTVVKLDDCRGLPLGAIHTKAARADADGWHWPNIKILDSQINLAKDAPPDSFDPLAMLGNREGKLAYKCEGCYDRRGWPHKRYEGVLE